MIWRRCFRTGLTWSNLRKIGRLKWKLKVEVWYFGCVLMQVVMAVPTVATARAATATVVDTEVAMEMDMVQATVVMTAMEAAATEAVAMDRTAMTNTAEVAAAATAVAKDSSSIADIQPGLYLGQVCLYHYDY